jgi:hypothetical protein
MDQRNTLRVKRSVAVSLAPPMPSDLASSVVAFRITTFGRKLPDAHVTAYYGSIEAIPSSSQNAYSKGTHNCGSWNV